MKRSISLLDLGKIDYQRAYAIQRDVYDLCYRGKLLDTILFQENSPTITIGRSGSANNLLVDEKQLKENNIHVVYVDRGGDITYHGPGQCIVSLILHIKAYTNNIHEYLRQLEEVVIVLLATYGIHATRLENLSGVWVDNMKIASIGISVDHGITRHGIALNVNPDLSYFDTIVACGIKDIQMTSIKQLTKKDVLLDEIKKEFLKVFSEVFNVQYTDSEYKKGQFNYEN